MTETETWAPMTTTAMIMTRACVRGSASCLRPHQPTIAPHLAVRRKLHHHRHRGHCGRLKLESGECSHDHDDSPCFERAVLMNKLYCMIMVYQFSWRLYRVVHVVMVHLLLRNAILRCKFSNNLLSWRTLWIKRCVDSHARAQTEKGNLARRCNKKVRDVTHFLSINLHFSV